MSWVLVVEDEPALRADLVTYLGMRGFKAEGTGSAAGVAELMAAGPPPAIVILDIGLPDGDGREIARQLRATHSCGVIMLTALREADERVRGYDSGADIYLVKHTSLREIEAAMNSLLRRMQGSSQRAISPTSRQWVLHRPSWSLVAPDLSAVKLTATEVAFLTVLMTAINETCLRDDLVSTLARRHTTFDNRHLDAVVSRLRRKIEKSTDIPSPIKVIYGCGYAFTSPGCIE